MRSKLLIMSAAALLAGSFAAAGQSIQPGAAASEKGSQGVKSNEDARDQAPKSGQAKGGQAQRNRGDDRQGQAQPDQNKLKGQTQGQAQRDQDKLKGQTQGQVQRDQDKLKVQTQGQAPRDQDKLKGQTEGQAPRDQDRQRPGQTQTPRDPDRQQQGQGQNQRDQDRVQQGERERSGSVSVTFTTEQRTKIRETVFKGNNAPRVSNVNFSINVGTVVPRTVRVIEIPDVIVEIHPEWRGFRYFIVNEELVIVEPDTLRIVAVIDV
jgi:hypothetical protein